MKKTVDYNILEKLSDEDIKIVIKNTDLGFMLEPIKQNSKHYARYTKILGNRKINSVLVKKYMPSIVLELYQKNDTNYRKLIATSVKNLISAFMKILESDVNMISVEDLGLYETKDYIDLLSQIEEQPGNVIDLELFFLQLKLKDIAINDNTKQVIREEWKHIYEIKQIKRQNKLEIEQALKEQEIIQKEQIENIINSYDEKITELNNNIKIHEDDIQVKQNLITSLLQENTSNSNDIEMLKKDISKKEEEIHEVKEENIAYQQDINELHLQLNSEKYKCHEQWKKEFISEEQELISQKEELQTRIEELNENIETLFGQKEDLETYLENTQRMIDSYMETFHDEISASENNIKDMETENTVNRKTTNYVAGISLYVKRGTKDVETEECSSFSDYQMIMETNLEQIGCKMVEGELEDYFNAAINANLIPLLCGFGSRKAAVALIAARYGENPTIISIPCGFSDIEVLSYEINSANTDTVIIEDLFGKMNEGIILPILRSSINKQLIFCCEDVQNIKYVDQYYFYYVQLITVKKTNIKKAEQLVYSDARGLFKMQHIHNKTEGHKLVRNLFDIDSISDVFRMTRGEMLTYIMDTFHHSREEALLKWFKSEIKWIITKEQRENIIEIIEGNEAKFGNELADSLQL